MMEEVLDQNIIVSSREIHMHSGTSDNNASTANAADLLMNYIHSDHCIVYTHALVVNDVFAEEKVWKKFAGQVHKVMTYFYRHQKTEHALAQMQIKNGTTADPLQCLRHDISTLRHSHFAAKFVYLSSMA